MRPPLLFRLLPDRLKTALFYRRYNPAPERWHPLFAAAPLRYAPGITMELIPTDVLHGNIAFTGFYELPLTRRVRALARGGGTMVDVGANAGYFSLLWASASPENRCIAFEASPRNAELIRRNLQRNGVEDRVELHLLAAGKSAGELDFDPGPPEQTGWGGFAHAGTTDRVRVPVVRIDETLQPESSIDLLKVDVEGAEAWVLMGCERLLAARRIREIHFEQNRVRARALGIGDGEAVAFLRSVGYRATPRGDPDGPTVDWVAVPT